MEPPAGTVSGEGSEGTESGGLVNITANFRHQVLTMNFKPNPGSAPVSQDTIHYHFVMNAYLDLI